MDGPYPRPRHRRARRGVRASVRNRPIRTPLLIVSGVDKAAMDSAAVSLLWDLPQSVAVTHSIDPGSQVLTRIVSDMSGRVEHEQIDLEHACVGCALREDILPTIERLARDGRWTSIVATLPVGAEPDHVSRVMTRDANLAGRVRLASVLVALGPDRIVEDFLGTDRLIDRGLHASPDDVRGLGETIAGMVEYADVIVTTDEVPDPTARDLLRALQRPGTRLLNGTESLSGGSLIDGLYRRSRSERALISTVWRRPTCCGSRPVGWRAGCRRWASRRSPSARSPGLDGRADAEDPRGLRRGHNGLSAGHAT